MSYLLLIFIFMLTEGFYSGAETGAYCLNKIRLRFRAEQRWRSALILQRLLADPQGLICTTLIGTNVSVYISTTLLTSRLEAMHVPASDLVSTMCLSPILLIFAETIPKNVFQAHADGVMYLLAPSLAFFRRLFAPGVWALKKVTNALSSRAAQPRPDALFTARRLRYFIDQSTQEGVLTPYQRAMTRNVMQLGQTPIRSAMIALDDVVLASKSADPEEFQRISTERRFSRIPVYEDEPRRIVGVVNLLDFFCGDNGQELDRIMRPPVTIPQDTPIDDALLVLQQESSPMGVVVDGDGNAVGIVTIKDLVEEIVGELEVW